MASLRQIRRSLRSVHNTKQIMRAMQIVSGSKLKRAQGRLVQARQTLEFLDGLLGRVLASMAVQPPPSRRPRSRQAEEAGASMAHPLCVSQEGKPSALVFFTSDAGLCGSYNANLIQLAEAHLRRDAARRTHVIYIGKKGHRYFTKRGYGAADAYLDLAGRPDLAKAEAIGRALMASFLSGQVGSIALLYSRFLSATVCRPTIRPWLPVRLSSPEAVRGSGFGVRGSAQPPAQSPQPPAALEYIFEPSPKTVFDDLLPRWALATFQLIMLEAFTSEHSARMIAMKNATDNAETIVGELTMQRNKIRQAAITKELSEIVGTSEALK